MPDLTYPAQELRAMLQDGRRTEAAALALDLVAGTFELAAVGVTFTLDEYSLNSVSGRIRLDDGTERFFKFHQEEGEEEHVAEYYRAQLLEGAGLPVDVPLAVSTRPGRQIALYELHTEPRMADVCLKLEREQGARARLTPAVLAGRRALDRRIGEVQTATLDTGSGAGAAIHQLFHHRLVDPDGAFPGGRYAAWYAADADWPDLADRRWRVNGVAYDLTLRQLFEQAHRLLDPAVLGAMPVVTAHGDDHHGNVWAVPVDGGARTELRMFDPAFAGDDIPALLAPVKATFHNALAHPMWLYHPQEAADRFSVRVRDDGTTLHLDHDAVLPPLRRQILDSGAELVWAPLLAELRRRDALPADWRATVRAALFACPTLVTNLLAPSRPPAARLLGLAAAVAAGCEPVDGTDPVANFLDALEGVA